MDEYGKMGKLLHEVIKNEQVLVFLFLRRKIILLFDGHIEI
jgi:hypothetical protein